MRLNGEWRSIPLDEKSFSSFPEKSSSWMKDRGLESRGARTWTFWQSIRNSIQGLLSGGSSDEWSGSCVWPFVRVADWELICSLLPHEQPRPSTGAVEIKSVEPHLKFWNVSQDMEVLSLCFKS